MTPLKRRYFAWMMQLVSARPDKDRRLLSHLHKIPFRYSIPRDGNRAEDGVDLRYRFGYEHHIDSRVIAAKLDDTDCSVLEMMIALCIRCEDAVMSNPDLGDRVGVWFWDMIESLGLEDVDDDNFDEDYISEVIDRFLDREYERDGRGGLFTLPDCEKDMRSAEIWYQAMWYFNTRE